MDSRKSGRVRCRSRPAGTGADVRACDRDRRQAPRLPDRAAGCPGTAQRCLQGDRRGQGQGRQRGGRSADQGSRRSQGTHQDSRRRGARDRSRSSTPISRRIPNLLADDVPDGKSDADNIESAQGRHAAQLRLRRQGPCRSRRRPRADGFRARPRRCRARASWCCRRISPGWSARSAQFMLDLHTTRARLYRSLAAAAGARRGGVRHRAAAQIQGRPVPDHRRPLADSDL